MAAVSNVYAGLEDDADRMVEAWRSRVAGQAESHERLAAEGNLAVSILHQDQSAQAERVLRMLHEVQMHVLGAEHLDTLTNAGNLASSLSGRGKHAHADGSTREVLMAQTRVFQAEHPDTLARADDLGVTLAHRGEYAEAEQSAACRACTASAWSDPPIPTRCTPHATWRSVLRIGAIPLTNTAAPTAKLRPLPAGTRALVQRLVAKPELKQKRARTRCRSARAPAGTR
jgi:hypothetical protein